MAFTQEKFKRLFYLMKDKGVEPEGFELLTNLMLSHKENKKKMMEMYDGKLTYKKEKKPVC